MLDAEMNAILERIEELAQEIEGTKHPYIAEELREIIEARRSIAENKDTGLSQRLWEGMCALICSDESLNNRLADAWSRTSPGGIDKIPQWLENELQPVRERLERIDVAPSKNGDSVRWAYQKAADEVETEKLPEAALRYWAWFQRSQKPFYGENEERYGDWGTYA